MRILLTHPGPRFAVHDLFTGWGEALRAAGQTVIDYPLGDALTFYDKALFEVAPGQFKKALTSGQATGLAGDRLAAALYKVRPDVLFIVSGFFVDHRLLDVALHDGVKVVLLCTESPYEDERQAALAEHTTLTVVDDPTNLTRFPDHTIYLPKAYRTSVHHPGPVDPALECDLSFVGTAYQSRIEFFEALDLDGVDVLLAGNWQGLAGDSPLHRHLAHRPEDCLDNEDAVKVYRSSKVGINLYRREAQAPELSAGWSMGPREVEMAACGLFFLRDPRGEGDEVLDMLPTFTTPADASQQLRWWLDRTDARAAAVEKARVAIEDRTFDNHAASLLRLLDKE